MCQVIQLRDIDVVVLCGGLGTRLWSVASDRPKVLARLGESTFLDILLHRLFSSGFERIVLCVGHMKEQVEEHIKRHNCENINISRESLPLGTGGALKNAMSLVQSDPFIVMNGDSVCAVDFESFVRFHLEKDSLLSIAVCLGSRDSCDFGTVVLNDELRVLSFIERLSISDNIGYVNAGVYLVQRGALSYAPDQDIFSLERDFFPSIVNSGRCFGFLVEGNVLDIGTPEGYKRALKFFEERGV
jgi:NDP-sugar pyrophosphorylase family protein